MKTGLLLAVVIVFVCVLPGIAQTEKPEALKAAVEANPDSASAHWAYIKAMKFDSPELIQQYDTWIKKYPKSAVFPYVIGQALTNRENPRAKAYLLKAVALEPKFAAAWRALASDAERWGDFKASSAYLGKAVAAEPGNADYAFFYAGSFRSVDPEKYKTMSLAFVNNFPDHQRAAQALYWLAVGATNMNEKIKYCEMMRLKYPPEKYDWSAGGMSYYFNLLLGFEPERALTLAEEMVKHEALKKEWTGMISTVGSVLEARKLMEQEKGAEAYAVLKKIQLKKYDPFYNELQLLKAEATVLTGNVAVAYDSLMAVFAKSPNLKCKTRLMKYGEQINKNAEQVDAEIWKAITASTATASTFSLKNYLTKDYVTLEENKGKVVLLTYWFPGCGPCRAEFPHFENVVRKFNGKELVYLGINIFSSQNEYVVPFVRQSGYSFIPLEDVKDRKKGNLDNRGIAPMNFLIDKQGRLIFSGFRTSGDNEADLEMMIRMLMKDRKV